MSELTTKRLLGTLLAVVLLASCRTLAAKSNLSDFKSEKDKLTLRVGEKLTYAVYWMKMPVGRGVTHVKAITEIDGELVYQLVSYTKANKFIRLFYKVDDRITSYVTVDGFRPLRFEKKLEEGKRKKEETIEFDWEKKTATYYKGIGKNRKKRKTISIKENTQDPLSCMFFLRSMQMKVGEERIMTVSTGKKSWDVSVKPVGKTKLKIRNVGTFNVLCLEPTVDFEGLFVHDRKLTIWLDEETKIPLMVLADIPIGSIKLILCDVENTEEKEKGEKSSIPEKQKETPWTRKPRADRAG